MLREREDHVEFKEAKRDYPFAGGDKTEAKDRRRCVLGYVVALANEKGGRLVLGMSDAVPHKVVGSDFARGDENELENEIYERLHIRVHNEVLYENGLRVLVINVPSRPIGKALRFEGVPLMRTGESLREMDDAEYFSIISEQDPDFSARVCEGLLMEDLDEEAIRRMRTYISEKRNFPGILSMPVAQMLSDLSLISFEGKLTYASLILLGKPEAIRRFLPQDNVVVEYRTSHSLDRYSARKEFRGPLIAIIDHIWDYINQPAANPLQHVNDLPVVLDIPSFSKETVREAILNAMVHRNLQQVGDVFVKQYPDVLEVINPGGFPYGVNVGNILTVPSSPRNRLMAETLEKTGLIERSGQGVDIMFGNCVKEGKPLPDYSNSDDYQVCLRIYGKIENPRLFLFISKSEETYNSLELLNMYFVEKGLVDELYTSAMERLMDEKVIVRDDYFRYVFGERFFSIIYPRRSDKYGGDLIGRIYYAIRKYEGTISSGMLIEELKDALSPKNVRTMIGKMCSDGYLSSRGSGRGTKYVWVERDW